MWQINNKTLYKDTSKLLILVDLVWIGDLQKYIILEYKVTKDLLKNRIYTNEDIKKIMTY